MGCAVSVISAKVLVPGRAEGEVLYLEKDLSFWGAVDPLNGRVIDHRHPQFGEFVEDKIVMLRRSVGSSSGSAILMETLQRGCGPAGIILGEADQILTLGAVVAREMGYASIPVFQLEFNAFDRISGQIAMSEQGEIKISTSDC
jgi:predicted aconitase with swiveling domain